MILLIDDNKDFPADIIARTAQEGMDALSKYPITQLLLDNDLGEKMEGWEILEWALANNLLPSRVIIVSNNPPAKQRMALALVSNGYTSFDSRSFSKV